MKNQPQKSNSANGQSGFSLIEVILVMVITAITFVGIYSVFGTTLKFNVENRRDIIAANLAQEGIELIRNIRDTNVLKGEKTNLLPNGLCNPSFGAEPDCNDGEIVCQKGATSYRYFTKSTDCGSDITTGFTRSCKIESGSLSNTYKVTCTVTWNAFDVSGTERKVEAQALLSEWGVE